MSTGLKGNLSMRQLTRNSLHKGSYLRINSFLIEKKYKSAIADENSIIKLFNTKANYMMFISRKKDNP